MMRLKNFQLLQKKYPIITKVEKDVSLNSIMSNSFGFGGTNATLVFEKV